MQSFNQIKAFHLINNRIATAGQPSMHELETLADAGFQVVINLGLHDADYAIENEQSWVEQLGMRYIHLPVEFQQPKTSDFTHFLNRPY